EPGGRRLDHQAAEPFPSPGPANHARVTPADRAISDVQSPRRRVLFALDMARPRRDRVRARFGTNRLRSAFSTGAVIFDRILRRDRRLAQLGTNRLDPSRNGRYRLKKRAEYPSGISGIHVFGLRTGLFHTYWTRRDHT